MFPHTLSVVRKNNEGEYTVFTDKGYYWSGSHSRNVSNQGAELGNSIQIICPIAKKDKIQLGDYLLKGSYRLSIDSVADLEGYDYVTVVSKEVYDAGSVVDNVIIRCQ